MIAWASAQLADPPRNQSEDKPYQITQIFIKAIYSVINRLFFRPIIQVDYSDDLKNTFAAIEISVGYNAVNELSTISAAVNTIAFRPLSKH